METVLRIAIVYVFVFIGLRVMGKREFSQMAPMELVTLLLIPEIVAQSLVREDFSLGVRPRASVPARGTRTPYRSIDGRGAGRRLQEPRRPPDREPRLAPPLRRAPARRCRPNEGGTMARNDDRPFEFSVQKHLKGVDYPASKEDLLDAARGNEAPDEVIDALDRVEDREYDGPAEVTEAIADLE